MKLRLVPLALAVAALAAAASPAAASSGEISWYAQGKLIPVGESLPITIKGKLSLYVENTFKRVTCTISAAGTVENTATAGIDSIESFETKGCHGETGSGTELKSKACPPGEKFSMLPAGLPWHGRLENPSQDRIEGIGLVVGCPNVSQLGIAGTIEPTITPGFLEFPFEEDNVLRTGELPALLVGHLALKGPAGRKQISAIQSL